MNCPRVVDTNRRTGLQAVDDTLLQTACNGLKAYLGAIRCRQARPRPADARTQHSHGVPLGTTCHESGMVLAGRDPVTLLFPQDRNFPRCQALATALRRGEAEGWIEPLVIHELTYVLQRTGRFPTRDASHEYIRGILLIDSIHADDKDALLDATARWAIDGVRFTDAWIGVLAGRRKLPVCSVNIRHFPTIENTFSSE